MWWRTFSGKLGRGKGMTPPHIELEQPGIYVIRAQGQLSSEWVDFFQGMTITAERSEDGSSIVVLAGRLVDQAALQGILNSPYSLGLPLISVARLERDA
jgi:hypothetical protein